MGFKLPKQVSMMITSLQILQMVAGALFNIHGFYMLCKLILNFHAGFLLIPNLHRISVCQLDRHKKLIFSSFVKLKVYLALGNFTTSSWLWSCTCLTWSCLLTFSTTRTLHLKGRRDTLIKSSYGWMMPLYVLLPKCYQIFTWIRQRTLSTMTDHESEVWSISYYFDFFVWSLAAKVDKTVLWRLYL